MVQNETIGNANWAVGGCIYTFPYVILTSFFYFIFFYIKISFSFFPFLLATKYFNINIYIYIYTPTKKIELKARVFKLMLNTGPPL